MIHASLFSGIGGPEVAAAMLGWENAFHCEINPFGRAVLEYWFPESMSYEDITKTSFKEWRGQIDVLTGGFPCQPFSYAGKRGGRDDDRYLWPEMLRVIDEVRPAWVVGENVAGITTMVEGGVLADLGCDSSLFAAGDDLHRYELDQPFTIERICRDLERLGYSVQPTLVPAAAVGAPHRRDRIFIIAFDANSNLGNVFGHAGGDASTEEAERVSKRDKVCEHGDATKIRSEVREYASDTYGPGREEPQLTGWEENCEEDGARLHDRAERPRRDGNVTNTEVEQHGEPEPRERENSGRQKGTLGRDNCEGFAMWVCEGLEREDEPWSRKEGQRMRVRGNLTGHDWEDLLPENRWRDFPTVSAVHRGNDGLPFSLDNLTISATKWRTESLKAYGNAIVPQVMYRIFQAIEKVSKQ